MTAWLAFVLEAALRALALGAVVGLALRLLRVLNVPARKAAWTLVLFAATAMPLLMRAVPPRMGWVLPIRFAPAVKAPAGPFQPPAAVATVVVQPIPAPTAGKRTPERVAASRARPATESAPAASALFAIHLSPSAVAAPAAAAEPSSARPRPFRRATAVQLAAGIYFAVAAFLLLRLGIGLLAALRLWVTADRVSPLIAPEPNVRSSARIASPVTIGSGVVLPADYIDWDARKLRMVMAHERSHVRQMDFYIQTLASLYAAILWFSPLGWWLRRSLSALGESLSDRAGLSAAASRTSYASLVLEFASLPHKLLPGVAMAHSSNLSRRVDSMLNESLFRTLFSEGRRRAMASLLVIPAALFAVTALVRVPSASAQSVPQNTQPPHAQTATTGQSNPPENQVTRTDASPDAAPAALPQDQAAPAPAPMPPTPAAASGPVPAAPAEAPVPPAPGGAVQPDSVIAPDTSSSITTDDGPEAIAILKNGDSLTIHGPHAYVHTDGQTVNGDTFRFSTTGDSWALVSGPGNEYSFSGEWGDGIRAEIDRARTMTRGPFLWFRHDGKSYIDTDPEVIARLQKLYEPMRELGLRQAALGKQQEALGRMQEDIAHSRDLNVTIKMPDLSKEMADINAQIAQMKVDQYRVDAKALADLTAQLNATVGQTMTQEKLAEIQQRIASIQVQLTPEKIAEMQAKLGEMQARLGALQGEAGAKNGDFGARMGELGEKQGRLGEQQGRLGEEQGRLSEDMNRSMQQIIDQALQSGSAKPVQ